MIFKMRPGCISGQHDKHGACYNCCDRCNYDMHRCPACGIDLYHDSFEDDASTRRHWMSDCRPDLVESGELTDGPMV